MSENAEYNEIEKRYLDGLIHGEVTTTTFTFSTPKGVVEGRKVQKKESNQDRLEYLRMKNPEKWKLPEAAPVVSISQNTIEVGLDDLRQLLIPK
jgi:predicted DNA-binding protein (UPF0251 family)